MADLRKPSQNDERDPALGAGASETADWAARATGDGEGARPRNKGGRPKGRKDSRPRRRPGQRPAAEAPEPEAPPVDDTPPTEAEVSGTGQMLGIAWRLMGARMNRRPLTPTEQNELALAAIPMMRKYGGGFLEQYGAEITFGMVVLGLWERTKQEPAPGVVEIPETHYAEDPDRHGETAGA